MEEKRIISNSMKSNNCSSRESSFGLEDDAYFEYLYQLALSTSKEMEDIQDEKTNL